MKYHYNYKNGGFLGFEGVQINQKEITDIVAEITNNDTHLNIEVTYHDDNVEVLDCDFERTNNNKRVRLYNIKQYWNDELIQGDDDE